MPIISRAGTLLRRSVLLLAAAVALAGCDATAAPPVPGDTPRQVTVVGNGKVDGTPDTLTADASITFTAPDVTSAMNQTNERQQAVIDALVNAGIDAKDITTSNVTLQSQYDSDGTDVIGYQASNSIEVKVRDLGNASRVLALIASTGGNATRLNAVQLSINDDSQLVKDARARAFEDAKDRAQQFADLSGLTLGKIISISETAGAAPPPAPVPMPRGPMADAAVSAVPIQPGSQTVSFDVTAVWELT